MGNDKVFTTHEVPGLTPGQTLVLVNQTSTAMKVRVKGVLGTCVETVLLLGAEITITAGREDLTIETYDMPDAPQFGQLRSVPAAEG